MSRTTTETHPQMPPVQLNRDEARVLAECERESLMYRSIPLGLMTYFATQYAMSRNLITTKGKWFNNIVHNNLCKLLCRGKNIYCIK